jgi:rRNA-processing protein FCF1
MADEPAVLFLDTNVLLHFKPLREIDWKSVADAKTVRLVLSSPVLDELDDKKNDPKTAERARATIAQLKQIEVAQWQVRDGVTLETITDDEEADSNRDAAIIQRVLDYSRQHQGQRVAVVSDDYNMSQRCRARGVACIELDEQWRKPVEDETARKLRKTEEELQRVKNRLPDLRLLVSLGEDATPVDVLDVPLAEPDEIDIEEVLADVQKAHPRVSPDNANFDRAEVEEYNAKLDKFYTKYREYLEHLDMHQNAKALTVGLSLWIENRGTCPAGDVRATLWLPDQFLLVIKERDMSRYVNAHVRHMDATMEALFICPRKPVAPKRPRPRIQPQFSDLRATLRAVRGETMWPNPIRDALAMPDIDMDFHRSIEVEGNTVRLWEKKISHNDLACTGTVLAVFADWDKARPFEASYEIHTDDHPDKFSGKIVIRPRAVSQVGSDLPSGAPNG